MSCEEKLQKLDLFNLEKRWLGWGLTAAPDTYGEGTQELEPGFSQQCVVGGDELWAEVERREVQTGDKETLFPGGTGLGRGVGCPGRLCRLHPWRFPSPDSARP